MAQVRIVTDSSAELTLEAAAALNITVVPWRLRLGAETVTDEPARRNPSFYKELARRRVLPVALPPGAADLRAAYGALCGENTDIISIHPSLELAPLLRAAHQARAGFLGRCQIAVINAQFISRALGSLVTEAATAAQQGMPAADVVRLVHNRIPNTYMAVHVENREHLTRLGLYREDNTVLPEGAARPLLLIEQGQFVPLIRSRNRGTPVERLVEFVAEFQRCDQVALLHAGAPATVQQFAEQLALVLPGLTFEEHVYGPVFYSYAGPHALCLMVREHV
ncbi:MAG: DegV family protein [Chloroflexota bacterium]